MYLVYLVYNVYVIPLNIFRLSMLDSTHKEKENHQVVADLLQNSDKVIKNLKYLNIVYILKITFIKKIPKIN